uniref:Microbial-type PARG catalytic domain-containing protein n=1 Tax=Chromera velia CCMP2878 TaxID=1169474 RepID=A0A0G4HP38_9ALVE|eukprot:Cvel_1207.t1-p1 / transcript=Cvel_1207.t1 / gene=Cvel_1207 / organism=Chromera_velia_CCMP2878 / gene_product=hypothetical protein / transcript_product=hypothetical protein / location=Cvel_scaffold40:44285-45196(+) / protein_length=304 / sequence_SO=supercontig / SO=protein_coding / is_pseudo=false
MPPKDVAKGQAGGAGGNREGRKRTAEETVLILQSGLYRNAKGEAVSFADDLARAISGSTLFSEAESAGLRAQPFKKTFDTPFMYVVNAGSLQAASRLVDLGCVDPLVLNFASAKNPGGGFLNGSLAQEESLALCSGLYFCIKDSGMHAHNAAIKPNDGVYSHLMVYSPKVPVLRDDQTLELLDSPFQVSFLTAPAVNAGHARKHGYSESQILEIMEDRMGRVLAIAAAKGHRHLVLGAWGCGVFGNSPEDIAALFRAALSGRFRGVFETIVFAVLSRNEKDGSHSTFSKGFPDAKTELPLIPRA